eukprot:830553-Amphidinium_carterae.1
MLGTRVRSGKRALAAFSTQLSDFQAPAFGAVHCVAGWGSRSEWSGTAVVGASTSVMSTVFGAKAVLGSPQSEREESPLHLEQGSVLSQHATSRFKTSSFGVPRPAHPDLPGVKQAEGRCAFDGKSNP